MSGISTSDKITNLWPATSTRRTGKSGSRKNSSNNNRDKKSKDENEEVVEEGPGKNIDEYA